MTSSDALAAVFIAFFVGAFAWTILYLLALYAFSRSLQAHAPLLWSARAATGLFTQSNIQRAFAIYFDSETRNLLLPAECVPSRNTVRVRLVVAGILILVSMLIATIL